MIRLALFTAFLALSVGLSAQDNCRDCHAKLEDETLSQPANAMADDVHATAGISCADCHGGDPNIVVSEDNYDLAMDPNKGYTGTPEPRDIPELCGKCHSNAAYMHNYDPNVSTDQLPQYWTSVHGQRLREGAKDVAHCASCHNAHGVRRARDPRSPVYPTRVANTCGRCHADAGLMESYGIPTDQLTQYRASVHGRALLEKGDLGAPTCNSCHGNHGAAPPGVSSVSLVCGQCHAIQKELFAQSPHKEAFDAMDEPECETCHGNHEVALTEDTMLGIEEGAVCAECHSEGESAYTIAQTMRGEIESLKRDISRASNIVDTAARAGMEVSEAEMALVDANQTLVQSRNFVHTISVEKLAEKVNAGRTICTQAEQMGQDALAELQFRRKGLAVSVIFILMAAVGLYLKVRQIESST